MRRQRDYFPQLRYTSPWRCTPGAVKLIVTESWEAWQVDAEQVLAFRHGRVIDAAMPLDRR